MDRSTPTASDLWRFLGDALAGFFRAAPAHQIRRTPGAVLALSGEAATDLNWVAIGAGPDPAAQLREFGTILQAQQLPAAVLVSAAVADDLAPVARELNLTHAGGLPLMTHDRPMMAPAEGQVTVTHVESSADARRVNGIIARAFSLPEDAVQRTWGPALLDAPGFALFLASQGDTPVSTVTTCQHGTTVGIWSMATEPTSQRQGIGATLLTHVLAQHRASGARLFYLAASEAGYPLYERVGFRAVETMTLWVAGQSSQAHG